MSTQSPNECVDNLSTTVKIVSAFVAHNAIPASDLPTLLQNVHQALVGLSTGGGCQQSAMLTKEPAVPVSQSLKSDFIVCLEDGKMLRSLKRHLRAYHGMTPEDYRRKWGLAADYPMVAPGYRKRRSEIAMAIGLGRKSGNDDADDDQRPDLTQQETNLR